jgi:glycosyltransferase involved in cell wall biosynthesis
MGAGLSRRVCLIPHLSGVGGMVSFQHKLATGLKRRGVDVCYDLADPPYASVLVVGGTRQLAALWRTRRKGIPIIQRLDGMNWVHRLRNRDGTRRTGLRHALRAEYGNLVLRIIRSRLAQCIVYQSEFSRRWWERVHGKTRLPDVVVYNGVDLDQYTPVGASQRLEGRMRLLLVEGSLMGGYETGLEVAMQLAVKLEQRLRTASDHSYSHKATGAVELMVVGRVAPEVQTYWQQRSPLTIHWAGLVPQERIPEIDRSAHLLYSADVNAACPNSVVEALACGLPVVAFDTGALPELVVGDAGRIAAYGGDPWHLEPPNVPALVEAALEVLGDQNHFRRAARERAESALGLDQMVDSYLQVLLDA